MPRPYAGGTAQIMERRGRPAPAAIAKPRLLGDKGAQTPAVAGNDTLFKDSL